MQKGIETARASLVLLYEVGREVAAALDLGTVLQRVLSLSMKNVGAISGSIIVLDDNAKPVESAFQMVGHVHDDATLQLQATYEHGLAGWVARHQQAVLIEDTSKDARWLRRPDDAEDQTGPKSAVSAPIITRDKLVGVITLVHPRPGLFTYEHLALARAIADQAASAIRNAQLYQSLQAAHRRYRELFEDSIDPIVISDWSGEVLEINRQAEIAVGLERAQILEMNIAALHTIDMDCLGAGFCRLEDGDTLSYESELHAAGAHTIPVQVYVRCIQDAGERQLQWILRDITERKDLDRMREDLIAMVYHDLRSPLANVVSSLELLASMPICEASETEKSLLTIALRSTDRIQRLTNSLLDINRLEAGQTVGNRQPVQPAGLIGEAVEAVLPNAANREMELSWEANPELPKIYADPDMIRRVLINLLENAIKFTPVKGRIQVSARAKDTWIEFAVSDSGSGVPEEDQERIFEKFSRLAPKDGPRGLGLGLAYCRLAIQAHGGKIWVENQPGSGARFAFTIPMARRPGLDTR